MSHSSVDKLTNLGEAMLMRMHREGEIEPTGRELIEVYALVRRGLAFWIGDSSQLTPAGRERAAAILSERREVSGWFCRC